MPRVKSQTSLARRGAVYQLRVHVPRYVRQHFNDRAEIRVSLRTKDKADAVKLVATERLRILGEFERLRNGDKHEIWEWQKVGPIPALFGPDETWIAVRPDGSPPGASVLLLDLVKYWKELIPRRPATVAQVEFAVKTFTSVTGRADALRVDRQAIIKWRDHLLQGRSPRTALKAVRLLSGVLSTAVDAGKIPTNACLGIKIPIKDSAPKRVAFTEDEVRLMLGALPDDALRWVVILALCTGARLGEIVQLRASDFGQEGGHRFIRITVEAGPLKTTASARRIPIHAKLIDLGLDAFLNGKSGKLFDFRPGSASKAFNRWLRRIGIKDKTRTAHSARHWLRAQLRLHGVDEEAADQIMGHAHSSTGAKYGAADYPLQPLAAAVNKLVFPL